jgi:hypothetical protein
MNSTAAQKPPNPIQLLISLVIDYVRWTQLTPMILMWAMMLGVVFILFFVNHEDATWSVVQRLTEWVASLPWLGPKFVAFLESRADDGTISAGSGQIDLKSAVLTAWGVMSLAFMVIGWLSARVFGPRKPWSLKRKVAMAALASVFVVVILLALYFSDAATWNDGPLQVLFSATGMASVLFLVSAWCLAISHALGRLSAYVAETDFSRVRSGDDIG